MDPGLLAEFKQFLAFRAIQRDDTVKGHELNESRGSTLGQLSSPVDSAEDRTLTPLPPSPDRETSSSKPNNNGFPKKRLELENTYTRSSPNSEKQPESVLERSTTPRAFARRDKQARQNRLLSPTPPPIPTPSPDATPAPSNSRKRGRSPSPVSGPSKRRQTNNDHSNAPPHPYDTCETSYENRPGKRGGRVYETVNGTQQIKRTLMERLIHRHKKYEHVLKHGHLFGDKHGFYFNPYSFSAVNEANCHRIEKPKGYQPGRGNHDPIHVAIGLRDDYDFSSDIRLVRKAAIKFRPRNLTLKPGQKLTLKHYGPSTKKKINDYMYKRFPFLYHTRNESGEDSWAIDAMLSSYFASNSAYTKAGKNKKAKLYLKRNESGGQDDQDGRDEEDNGDRDDYQDVEDENDPDTNKAAYQDDYILNARRLKTTQTALPLNFLPKKRADHDLENKRPKARADRRYDKDEDDEDNEDDEDDEDEEPDLPPEPTPAQRRRADKVVAQETARNKTFSNSKGKAGAKPTAASKPGKRERSWGLYRKLPSQAAVVTRKRRVIVTRMRVRMRTTNRLQIKVYCAAGERERTQGQQEGKRKQLSPTVDTDEDAEKEELEPPRRRRPPVKVRQTQQDDHEDEELPPLPPRITHNSSSAKHTRLMDEPQVGPSKSAIEAVHTTQIDSEQLVNTGKAKAVGVIKIKRPPQHSSRELRPRT
ncbi:hypothetical protein RhiXN_12022 [Rhizoctonia solani]|uniref:Uncharacterized protein n=1 Tax=Rhizoctonia solani TaxID=456999 RepID=A0A8H8P9N5_9AGAM|nr:uncharacterized protein RhiXN_12022 [Rhizoctonia solani]QRW26361.1 hypothetical protein RhiXN_12022 [Rhizoctonia solani]